MEETSTGSTARRSWPDAALVALLLVLAGSLHAWLVAHATVTARDGIGYIRIALQLEAHPWIEVIQKIDQHPGYPLAVLLVSEPVRRLCGGTTPEAMVLSAQLTSAVMGTLLVVPMFYLGRRLFDRRTGFWAALLFQCLPVSAHVIGDALSEATFFLLLATALLLAAQALDSRSVWRLALCGLCGGLAYLTRPEGALVVLATLGVLLGLQLRKESRWPWRQAVAGTLALLLAALAVGGPYAATIGKFTPKPSGERLSSGNRSESSPPTEVEVRPTGSGRVVLASLFAVWLELRPYDAHDTHLWGGLWAVIAMTVRAFTYLAWLPALAGVWWFRDRLRSCPGACVVLLLCGGHLLILWRLAAVVGYVSERHALVIVFGGCFWAVALLATLVDRLVDLRLAPRWRPAAAVLLMALLTGFALPSVLKPLHANRAGHKAAGLWLAAHAGPDDFIVDPYCWAHYYAGKVFREEIPLQPNPAPTHWIILEESHNPHARLTLMDDAKLWVKYARPVYRWVPPKGHTDHAEEVVVYRFPPLP